MSTIETGGSAFPMQNSQAIHAFAVAAVDGIADPKERDRAYIMASAEAVGGMTLRDYLAAKVLPAVYADYCVSARQIGFDEKWKEGVAIDAYQMADAMLAARKSNPSQ